MPNADPNRGRAGRSGGSSSGRGASDRSRSAGDRGRGKPPEREVRDSRDRRFDGARRDAGAQRQEGSDRPLLPPDVVASQLDRSVWKELSTLPLGLAEVVATYLVAAGRTLDEDPAQALTYARHARKLAGRVAVVREAAGLAAYAAGEWSEALADLRAARRLSPQLGQFAVMADCERALARPEKAIELVLEADRSALDQAEIVELRIVEAGARRDLGQPDAAVLTLQGPELEAHTDEPWLARLRYAYADNLLAAGRLDEARKWFVAAADADLDDETDAADRAFELEPPQQGR